MTVSTPVKTAVVGLGRFGRLHSLTLNGLVEADLVGVVARREESLQSLAEELPDVSGWTNLEQAIEECEATAWVVACTTAQHVSVTRTLLNAGKTVLLEKPVSDSLDQARSLAPFVKADSGNLMLGHIVLFNSDFRALQEEAGKRGPISYIDSVRHRPASIVTDFSGENPLHAAMVHDLYMTQAIAGRAEPVQFSSQFHRTRSGAIDLALAQLKWDHGLVASFAASYLTPSGMPPRGFDRTEVFGEGWALRLLPNPRPLEVWSTQAEWPFALEIRTDESGPTGMMAEELRCFLRVARGEQSVPVGATYHDALQVQSWMDRLELNADQQATGPAGDRSGT